MKYNAVLETFEGPLDLLYHLIEKEKVDIYDIPIAKITDQYISYIEAMKELDLEITSEILLMAATLLEIKSKMLLPSRKDSRSEQLEIEEVDPREELVRRLIEYKKYKLVAEKLKDKEEASSKMYYKPKEEIDYVDEHDFTIDSLELSGLLSAYKKILKRCDDFEQNTKYTEIKRDEVTIEESMENVIGMITYRKRITFEELFIHQVTRTEVIVTFLAILELIKKNMVTVIQRENFDQIVIELKVLDKE